MINLIVAIVVDAMAEINKSEETMIIEQVHSSEVHTNDELIALKQEIKELKEYLRSKD